MLARPPDQQTVEPTLRGIQLRRMNLFTCAGTIELELSRLCGLLGVDNVFERAI